MENMTRNIFQLHMKRKNKEFSFGKRENAAHFLGFLVLLKYVKVLYGASSAK
jgi:hypothetical protein